MKFKIEKMPSKKATTRYANNTEQEPERDWEDDFRKLHEKHLTLKQLCNEQEEHIKMLHVKTRKIETAFAALERKQYSGVKGKSRHEEDQELITTLEQKVEELTRKNVDLVKKNKQYVDIDKKKSAKITSLERQVKDLKRRAAYKDVQGVPGRNKNNNTSIVQEDIDIVAAPSNLHKSPGRKSRTKDNDENANNSNILEIAKGYKARLDAAEGQLRVAREENDRLRGIDKSIGQNIPARSDTNDDLAVQLRDAKWRLQQLQTQHDHLVAKCESQQDAYKYSEDQLEDGARKVRELRRALEDLRHEKEITDIKAARVDDLEEAVVELRQTNRGLEEKISRLCEAPFISDAFGQHEAKLEFERVMVERQDYVAKVDHLQEAVRTQYSALVALKQQAAQLREEKEEAEKVADELRSKYSELEAGASLLQDKLRLYSGEDGVNIEDLERALTVVKRRSEAVGKLDFLEDVDDGFQDITMPALKKKAQDIQIMNLNLTKEVERLENMLKLQSNINRDLHKELESLSHKRDRDKREAAERSDDFEQLAMKRLHKIHTLEAQIRELVYSVGKKGHKHRPKSQGGENLPYNIAHAIEEMTATSETGTDNALLTEMLEERNGDIDPDENLLEVWIKGAKVRDNIVMPGSSTFAVVDFFDYESQTTSLLSGSHPQWDFGATFKIVVDDFLLRHLATDTITFELNMASQGDFTMLARCTAPLSGLLRAKPVLHLTNHPMISPRTGEVIAHLDADIRLALPLTELYRLFLERHPDERRLIEEKSAQQVVESANAIEKAKLQDSLQVGTLEDESRMYNELEVAIFHIKDLPKSGNTPPTPYVHFQLLGHPDKFTNPISNTCDPTFNERFNFPTVTNDQHCRLLRRSQLLLSVIDMKGEEASDDNEGLLGEVNISLAPLSEGSAISDTFSIKNQSGDRVGTLRIAVRWVHKFRPQRELGPRALTGVELETLISAFCPGLVKEGVVDYYAFLRFVNPPMGARRGMENIQSYLRNINERDGIPASELLQSITENVDRVDCDHFIRCFSRLEIDVLPEEWGDLFKFIDNNDENSITVDQMLAVLNLDEVAGIPSILQEKLTLQVRNVVSKGINPRDLFADLDTWGEPGKVTRMEFKLVLKKLGFQLVDEPEYDDARRSADMPEGFSNRSSEGNGVIGPGVRVSGDGDHDLLNNTFDSDDVLLPVGHMDSNIGDEIRRQKEIFQRKLDEIQQRTAQVAASQQASRKEKDDNMSTEDDDHVHFTRRRDDRGGIAMKASSRGPDNQEESKTFVGKNILDGADEGDDLQTPPRRQKDHFQHENDDVFRGQESHRMSVAAKGGAMEYDSDMYQKSATKIQSRFRGIAARKTKPSPPAGEKTDQRKSLSPSPSRVSSSQPIDVIQAEEVLRGMIKNFNGISSLPNFYAAFSTVDSRQTGYVNRKQFAHAMSQFDNFRIPHAELRSFMDFFDMGKEGLKIDYGAFVSFCRYRPVDILPAVRHLRSIVMLPDTIVKVHSMDTNGVGFLSRQDMLRILAELGYGHFSKSQALSMLALFETKIDGQVNYGNLIEYVRDGDLSRKTDSLCEAMRGIIMNKGGTSENNLRRWYRRLDREGAGVISMEGFAEFLAEFDLQQEQVVMSAAYRSMSETGSSSGCTVTFPSFSAWVAKPPENYSSLYPILSLAELQRKTNAYLRGILAHKDANLEEISQAYMLYDWKKPPRGSIRRPEFIRASQHAGFVFTHSELRTLCGEFKAKSNPQHVQYDKFLEWATPSKDGTEIDPSMRTSLTGIASKSSQARVTAILKTIEASLARGTDIMSVFGRYDSSNIGRITADEFCSGLSDLGLSSISQKDAFDLADKYKAAVGGFIMYRRILTELMNQMDERKGVSDVDVIDALMTAMRKANVRLDILRDKFQYYDRGRRSRVREEDLGTILEESRIRISRQELDALADRFAASSSGYIQYDRIISSLEARLGRDGYMDYKSSTVSGLPDHLADKISSLLESLIIRGRDFRAEMDSCDSNFSGSILQTDFRDILQEKLRAHLSIKELTTLEKAYADPNDPRKICHVKLLQDIHPRYYGKLTPEQQSILQLGEVLRQKIRRRCDYMTPGELKRPYRHFARRRAHLGFTAEELGVGLRDLGVKVSGDMEISLFNSMNLDGGRAVRYNHFVVFVCDPFHEDMNWKFQRAMSRARISGTEVMEALEEFDTNSSGLITAKQFSKALRNCNIEMSDSDISRFMLRFDNEDAQRFDIELFGKFLAGKLEFTDEETKSLRNSARKGLRDDEIGGSRAHNSSLEGTESRLFGSLRRRVEERLTAGFTEREVFTLFDDGNGTITVLSMQKGARELGLNLSRSESRTLLRRLGLSAGGIVDKLSFFDALDVENMHSRGSRSRDETRRHDRDDDRTKPELTSFLQGIIGSIIKEIRLTTDGIDFERGIRSALNRQDIDKDGLVRRREFSRAIEIIDRSLSSRDISKLFDYFDASNDGDGYISISSVLRTFRAFDGGKNRDDEQGRDYRKDSRRSGHAQVVFRKQPYLLDDVLNAAKDLLSRGRNLDDNFLRDCRRADHRGDGMLEKLNFSDCLRSGGLRLRPETERDLCDSLAQRGRIDYRDFIDIIKENLSADDDADDLFRMLKKKISREVKGGHELTEIFDRMDTDGSGNLSINELKDGLRKLGITINRDESEKIMDKFALTGGTIRFRDFVKACAPMTSSKRDEKHMFAESLIMRIRGKLRDRYGSENLSIRRAQRAFENIDENSDGQLSPREFRNGMASLKVDITLEDAEKIIDYLDPSGNGKLDYKHFVEVLGGVKPKVHSEYSSQPSSPRRDNARVDDIVERIRSSLIRSFGDGPGAGRKLKEAFEDADRDNSGNIDKREFKKAMSFLGVDLSGGDVDDIYDRYDSQRDGRLDYTEFVDLLGLSRRRSSSGRDRDGGSRSPRRDNARVDDIVERIRSSLIRSFGDGPGAGRKLKEAFEDADRDNSGNIDKREFKKAMSFLGVDLSGGDVDDIYDRYDSQRDGRLDYTEFVDLLGLSRRRSSSGRDRDGGSRSPRRDNARVDDIVERIRSSLIRSFGDGPGAGRKLKEAFEDADRDNSGNIDKREFKKAMSFLGVDLSGGDVDDIYDRYDSQRDGRLDYTEFVDLLGLSRRRSSSGRDRDGGSRSPRRDNARVDDIVERIRSSLIRSFGDGPGAGRKLKEAFEDADRDNSGNIDKREFKKAMSFLGVDLSGGDVDDIYDRYDSQRDGRLDYTEFVDLLGLSRRRSSSGRDRDGGSRSPRRDNARVDDIVERIRSSLIRSFGDGPGAGRKLKEAFEDADRDNSGNIDKREFKKAMSFLGVDLSGGDVDDIYDRYDRQRDGRLDYTEFVDLLGLSRSSSRDSTRGSRTLKKF